ncbi:hypothetical protein ACLBXJ_23370 [Methylobacterium mesophilicum]
MSNTDEKMSFKSESDKLKVNPALAQKGKVFVQNVINFSQREDVKLVTKTAKLNYDMIKAAKISDPKRAGVLITSIAVRKAMLAAGFTTKSETKACVEAVGNLAGDFGMAALLGPETGGIGAVLPLVFAAIDAYDVGKTCFASDNQGPTTHAVVGQIRKDAKTGLKTSKHGPI